MCKHKSGTKSKLKSWDLFNDGICVFCHAAAESFGHLLLTSPSQFTIWNKVLIRNAVFRGSCQWSEELQWLCMHFIRNTFSGKEKRLALEAILHNTSGEPGILRKVQHKI